MAEKTLGVRLNNPGNIEWGANWEGLVPRPQSRYYNKGTPAQQRFCEFKDAASGIRAIVRTLITYADKRVAADGSAIDTIAEVVARWAPPSENATDAYAAHVAKIVGVDPNAKVNVKDYAIMKGLVVGIIAHENAGYAYPDEVVTEGLRRAGMVPAKSAAPVPMNTATMAGSAAPAALGLATLVPLAQPLADAVKSQQDNLASGDWIKVGIGAVLVGCAVLVAWDQYRKHRAGAL